MRVFLISCTKKKMKHNCFAKEMYSESNLFRLSYEYAKCEAADEDIFVLSAKYHLLPLHTKIAPYDETLNRASKEYKKKWALFVYEQLERKFNLEETTFVLLAGSNYTNDLIKLLPKYELPLQNMPLGIRMKYLKDNKKC